MKSCALFCDCGAINKNGRWEHVNISVTAFLADFIYRQTKLLELRRITCPNCIRLGSEDVASRVTLAA
jgi:hypothetical protein